MHKPILGLLLWLSVLGLADCAGSGPSTSALPLLPFTTDTFQTEALRPGVTHRFIYAPAGPWAVHVLEVALDRCYSARVVKGAPGAIGRQKTSILLSGLSQKVPVVGGVNADFFLFAPPGVPMGALISRGQVLTGPSSQPVLAFDSSGTARLTVLHVQGSATVNGRRFEVEGWNRAVPNGLALFDAGWGPFLDTASAVIEVLLEGTDPPRVSRVDTTRAGMAIPANGAVLLAGRDAPAEQRATLRTLRPGDTLRIALALTPFHPLEAVGGRPLLLVDSAVAGAVDTEGQPGFATGRHPRTAVGIGRRGKRLLLVVVDGRQKPYSDGMTLRELADLLLALGARDAINLDGGGSSTLVYAGANGGGALRIGNRPSDPAGERPVGDALAIVQGCARH